MVTVEANAPDDSTISRDLGMLFDLDTEELDELNQNNIPDSDSLTLMDLLRSW